MEKVINIDIKENKITHEIMDSFLKVHKAMGPGLLESIYEDCLAHELKKRALYFNVPLIKNGVKRFVHNFKENSAHSAPPR